MGWFGIWNRLQKRKKKKKKKKNFYHEGGASCSLADSSAAEKGCLGFSGRLVLPNPGRGVCCHVDILSIPSKKAAGRDGGSCLLLPIAYEVGAEDNLAALRHIQLSISMPPCEILHPTPYIDFEVELQYINRQPTQRIAKIPGFPARFFSRAGEERRGEERRGELNKGSLTLLSLSLSLRSASAT